MKCRDCSNSKRVNYGDYSRTYCSKYAGAYATEARHHCPLAQEEDTAKDASRDLFEEAKE